LSEKEQKWIDFEYVCKNCGSKDIKETSGVHGYISTSCNKCGSDSIVSINK
jgi:DNA-directed RNA polymerase subunit RPC12/RpoP